MAPTPPATMRRRCRCSGLALAAAAAAAAGYLATTGLFPGAWVGPLASRLGGDRRRLVAAQATGAYQTDVREPADMDYGEDYDREGMDYGREEDMDYGREEDEDYSPDRGRRDYGRRDYGRDSDYEVDPRARGDRRFRQRGGRFQGGKRQKRIWKYRTPVEDLKVGQEYEGKVVKMHMGKGVFVDIMAETWGFLRNAEMDATAGVDFKIPLAEGDKVHVRVLDINHEKEKFKLTCLPGDLTRDTRQRNLALERITDMSPFLVQTIFDGTVDSIASFGAFVAVRPTPNGEPVIGLFHRDWMSESMKRDLAVGAQVKVKLVNADEWKGHIGFKAVEINGVPVDCSRQSQQAGFEEGGQDTFGQDDRDWDDAV